MNSHPPEIELTPEQKHLLQHEKFLHEIKGIREEGDKPNKSWRDLIFNPTVATALVTLITTGIFGTFITHILQKNLKEREHQQAILKSEADQALLAYREFLQKEIQTVSGAYELIGEVISAADNLIFLTQKAFQPDPAIYKTQEDREAIVSQRKAIKETYNKAEAAWRQQRQTLGLLISYYHQGSPKVMDAWRECQNAVNSYISCARRWYASHPGPVDDIGNACSNERDQYQKELNELARTMETERRYLWSQRETKDGSKK